MDKLEAVRLASMRLNKAREEEESARKAARLSKTRLLIAEREYAKALEALHEPA